LSRQKQVSLAVPYGRRRTVPPGVFKGLHAKNTGKEQRTVAKASNRFFPGIMVLCLSEIKDA
jgi:hypothetical protein